MSKGLTRSLAHAKAGEEPAIKRYRYRVNTTVTVAAAGAGVAFGSAVIGDFPEGNILYLGGVSYLNFSTVDTDLTATWNGDYAVGTTVDADGSLAGTEINLIGSSPIGPAASRISNHQRGVSAADSSEVLDNTDNALELNLNVLVDAADFTDAGSAILTVTGYVDLFYAISGDD